jgi:hypothetical protein
MDGLDRLRMAGQPVPPWGLGGGTALMNELDISQSWQGEGDTSLARVKAIMTQND